MKRGLFIAATAAVAALPALPKPPAPEFFTLAVDRSKNFQFSHLGTTDDNIEVAEFWFRDADGWVTYSARIPLASVVHDEVPDG